MKLFFFSGTELFELVTGYLPLLGRGALIREFYRGRNQGFIFLLFLSPGLAFKQCKNAEVIILQNPYEESALWFECAPGFSGKCSSPRQWQLYQRRRDRDQNRGLSSQYGSAAKMLALAVCHFGFRGITFAKMKKILSLSTQNERTMQVVPHMRLGCQLCTKWAIQQNALDQGEETFTIHYKSVAVSLLSIWVLLWFTGKI